ncbi:MAG: methyltransferase [Proteobacteria bacterium]|nr:MAG: methyltransferase [Pseudomonadota bacterium]
MTILREVAGLDEVTEDAFLGGALSIFQPRQGYRAGLDAVLLAAAVPACGEAPERVLDAGSGVGVVGLCVARRVPTTKVTLVENESRLVALARRNVERNRLSDRVEVIEADVTAPGSALEAVGLKSDTFDHVVANPPYNEEGRGRRPKHPIKAAAHAMPAENLQRWVQFLTRVAAPGGSLTLIHRPDALPNLLPVLKGRFGGLKILPLHPRASEPAVRVIVQGRKGSRAPLAILPGIILHGEDNRFRPEIVEILRNGAALPLA